MALLVFAVFAVAVASTSNPETVAGRTDVDDLPVGPPVPGLGDAAGWINSAPLTHADLQGKVVLYDFWTYSCVNCVRKIPHLRAWYDRYQQDGLVVVGVHSPEFNFEKNHDNVDAAVARLHVDYPVALDDNKVIWSQFENNYWPADYITDRRGRLRAMTIGEGGYPHTENVLRKLLGVASGAPRADATDEGDVGRAPSAGTRVTPETYLGLERGTAGAEAGETRYPETGSLTRDTPRLVGRWFGDTQNVTSLEPGAAIVMRYRARAVNLVMASAAPANGPITVQIEVDGKPLPPSYRTVQTIVGADGSTSVSVQTSDLYRLVLGPSIGTRTLRLTAAAPNVQAFAFTFSA